MEEGKKVNERKQKGKMLAIIRRARLSAEFFVFFDGKMYRPEKRKT